MRTNGAKDKKKRKIRSDKGKKHNINSLTIAYGKVKTNSLTVRSY